MAEFLQRGNFTDHFTVIEKPHLPEKVINILQGKLYNKKAF
jgi:hypothetical protein